jgi:hypothetical protein
MALGAGWELFFFAVGQLDAREGVLLTVCVAVCCADVCRCGIDEETAARIAREIERGDTSNPHLAEERGQALDDSGVSRVWL